MNFVEFQRTRGRAERLYKEGKYRKALDAYEEIRCCGDQDPKVFLRLGDISRKLGDQYTALEDYKLAAEAYARRGFVVKAIAICKMIMSLDPTRENLEESLISLSKKLKEEEAAATAEKARPRTIAIPQVDNSIPHKEALLEEPLRVGSTELAEFETRRVEPEVTVEDESQNPSPVAPIETEGRSAFEEAFFGSGEPEPAPVVEPVAEPRPEPKEEPERLPEQSINATGHVKPSAPEEKEAPEYALFRSGGVGKGETPAKSARNISDFDFGIEDVIEEVVRVARDESAQSEGLGKTPLFSDMSTEELIGLIKRLNVHEYGMGDYVFSKGDVGNSIFIIISGAAEEISYTKYGEEIKCGTLMDGDFFGEREYFSGLARASEVKAVTDLELLEITRQEMGALSADHPNMSKVLYDFYKDRVVDRALALSKLFRHLSVTDRRELLDKVHVESFPQDALVVKEGEHGDTMFIVVSGTAEIWKLDALGNKKPIINLYDNDYFGEVALILKRERVASVSAFTTLDLVVITRADMEAVLLKYPVIKKVLEGVAAKHVRESG